MNQKILKKSQCTILTTRQPKSSQCSSITNSMKWEITSRPICSHSLCRMLLWSQLDSHFELNVLNWYSRILCAKRSTRWLIIFATSRFDNLSSPLRSSNSNSTCQNKLRCQKTKMISQRLQNASPQGSLRDWSPSRDLNLQWRPFLINRVKSVLLVSQCQSPSKKQRDKIKIKIKRKNQMLNSWCLKLQEEPDLWRDGLLMKHSRSILLRKPTDLIFARRTALTEHHTWSTNSWKRGRGTAMSRMCYWQGGAHCDTRALACKMTTNRVCLMWLPVQTPTTTSNPWISSTVLPLSKNYSRTTNKPKECKKLLSRRRSNSK